MQKEMIIAVVFIMICTWMDIKSKEIPIIIIVLFGILAAVCVIVTKSVECKQIIYSLIPGALLLALSLCTRENIGYGDGMIVLILGVLTGLETCTIIVATGLIASALCALSLLVCRKVTGKSRLPFVPFLAFGLGVVLFV